MDQYLSALPSLALALLICLVAAHYLWSVGVPKVTVYLLVGVLLGPNVMLRIFHPEGVGFLLLTDRTEDVFDLINQLAVGFILLRVGGEFRFRHLRRIGPRILVLSGTEILTTYVLVFLAVLAMTGNAALAALAPMLALSTAPGATLLTLRELEAEGPSSRCLILMVGLNNLFTLLAFPLVFTLSIQSESGSLDAGQPLLALLGGVGIGFCTALFLEVLTGRKEQTVLGILAVLGCLGYAHMLDPADSISAAMLTCFAAGVVIINGSPHAEELFGALEPVVYPVYVLFFVGSGRALHLESLGPAGVFGLAFVLARITGKLLGIRLGLRLSSWSDQLPTFLGTGMLCQAGVALGLVAALDGIPGTADLANVALASVVLFEIVGPILTRLTVVKAGEVKLANLVHLPDVPSLGPVREVTRELSRNLGTMHYGKIDEGGGVTVRHVMRRRPDVLPVNLSFEQLLRVLGETDTDILPVVDEDNMLRGIVDSHAVREILYDPHLRNLVIAEDLMDPVFDHLHPETPLAEAMSLLDSKHVHSWPVVEDGAFVGMLKRRDAYAALHKVIKHEDKKGAEDADVQAS